MVNLYNKRTGELIGQINERQLQFMIDTMEEESTTDRDYAITPLTLEYFATRGADKELLDLLRGALGGQDEIVVEWSGPQAVT